MYTSFWFRGLFYYMLKKIKSSGEILLKFIYRVRGRNWRYPKPVKQTDLGMIFNEMLFKNCMKHIFEFDAFF